MNKFLDKFIRAELPSNRYRHLKTGDTQEEHWMNVPADIGYIEDPSVKPNEKGIMHISADINLSTTYDKRR